MKRTQIQLPEDTWEQLRERAFRERISVAEMIRRMITQGIDETPSQKSHQEHEKSGFLELAGIGEAQGKKGLPISEYHDDALADIYEDQ